MRDVGARSPYESLRANGKERQNKAASSSRWTRVVPCHGNVGVSEAVDGIQG